MIGLLFGLFSIVSSKTVGIYSSNNAEDRDSRGIIRNATETIINNSFHFIFSRLSHENQQRVGSYIIYWPFFPFLLWGDVSHTVQQYFKPRRKMNETIATHENAGNITSQDSQQVV